MAGMARAIRCEIGVDKVGGLRKELGDTGPLQVTPVQRVRVMESEMNGKIVLQPRLCTLRSYGEDRFGVVKTRKDGGEEVSPFFETLSEYIESSKKSHDFEIISGRLAMIVFAATVTSELVTGNSVFGKMDLQGIEEGAGACLAAVTCAATFAWISSARNKVGRMFTISCNSFIDSLIDDIIDGVFYESETSDWSDDI